MTKIPFAILGREASDEEVDSFVAALKKRPAAAKYRPDQARGPRGTPQGGEFIDELDPIVGESVQPAESRGGRAAVLTDDPTRLENLPEEYRKELLARLQETFPGMTEEELEANIEEQLKQALADPSNAGKGWYEAARGEALELMKRYGVSEETAIGMIAGMSPQHEWGSNVATADFAARVLSEDGVIPDLSELVTKIRTIDGVDEKVTATAEDWARAEMADRDIEVGQIVGKRLSDFKDPEAQAAIIKAWGSTGAGDLGGKQVSYRDDQNGKSYGATWSCGVDGVTAAVRIYRGESPDIVLGGHKVRSFYNNIAGGGGRSDGSVTVDTHAYSAALGEKVTASDPRMGRINNGPSNRKYSTRGTYAIFADAYRRVAKKAGLPVEDVQALVWINWRKHNG